MTRGEIGSAELLSGEPAEAGSAEDGVIGVDPGEAEHMTAVLGDVARVRKEMYDAILLHKQEVDPEDPNYGEDLAQIYAMARKEVAGMIRKVSNRHTQIKTLAH